MTYKDKCMTKLTQEQKELLEHIASGGKVITKDARAKIEDVRIHIVDGDTIDFTDFFANYQKYLSPMELRIQELEALLKTQGEELQKALAKKQTTEGRKGRVSLSVGEVVDILKAMEAGVASNEIMNTYDIGQATASRIKTGKHHYCVRAQAIINKDK